jgi:3'(2'), 5'-bisphosphate nucleotidase
LTPQIPVLSEEAPDIGFAERSRWEWLWLVDPLDGTREFIKRSDQFSVNIALIHNHEAVFGLILSAGGRRLLLRLARRRRLQATDRNQPVAPHSGGAGLPLSGPGQSAARHPTAAVACRSIWPLGPHRHLFVGGALKSCLIAEGDGRFVPRFGPTGEWDTAAAQSDRGRSRRLSHRHAVHGRCATTPGRC